MSRQRAPREREGGLWSSLLFPFGSSEALDKLGSTAAPLLAGFAFALIGLTVGQRRHLGEPDLALLLLVVAGLLLIYAVQFTFIARGYHLSAGDYFNLVKLAKKDGVDEKVVTDLQVEYLKRHRAWVGRSRNAYNWGVVVLLFGVAATLIPKSGLSHMPPVRAAAVALMAAGGAVEAALVTSEWPRDQLKRLRRRRRRGPPAGQGAQANGTADRSITALLERVEAVEAELNRVRNGLELQDTDDGFAGGRLAVDATETRAKNRAEEARQVHSDGSKPTLRQAILVLLRDEPVKDWNAAAMVKELRGRGWSPPGKGAENQIRSMLADMDSRGQARRTGRGQYRSA